MWTKDVKKGCEQKWWGQIVNKRSEQKLLTKAFNNILIKSLKQISCELWCTKKVLRKLWSTFMNKKCEQKFLNVNKSGEQKLWIKVVSKSSKEKIIVHS